VILDLKTLQAALGGEISNDQLRCPGPGHSAADRSMCVKPSYLNDDGFVCSSFANDDWKTCKEYIREKAGLDKWRPANGGIAKPRIASTNGLDLNKAKQQRVAKAEESWGPWQEVHPSYVYTDQDGTVLYEVVRKERFNAAGDKDKTFIQRRPDGKGGWEWKQGKQRVLYRWPDLVAYPDATTFITEGEKDADRLASLGYCAATVANGNWKDVDLSCLRNRDMIILEDADEPGVKKAAEAAAKLHGLAKTLRVVRLPGHEQTTERRGKDVSDWLDEDPTRAETFVKACFDVPLWEPKEEEAEDFAPKDPGPFNVGEFSGPAPQRRWIVRDWIVEGVVNSLYGSGGIGKTLLAQQLAYCLDIGRPFLGIPVERKTTFCVLCEDNIDELHRRHDGIKDGLLGYTSDNPFNVTVWPRVGFDNLLVTWDHKNQPHLTEQFKEIWSEVLKKRPDMLILDTLADVYGGNEIVRVQVNYFIKTVLGRLILQAKDAGFTLTVLLLAHPSMSGEASGKGMSGSTAWENAVRARLYMRRPQEGHFDERELVRAKANYAASGEETILRMIYQNGFFAQTADAEDIAVSSAKQHLRDIVQSAWDGAKPYVAKKGHRRNIHIAGLDTLAGKGVTKEVGLQAIREMIEDEEIVTGKRGDRQGYRLPKAGGLAGEDE
jgi:hypothetical protein